MPDLEEKLRRPLDFAGGSRSHLRSLARLSGRGLAHDEPEPPNVTGPPVGLCRARRATRLPRRLTPQPAYGTAGQRIFRATLSDFAPFPHVLLWRLSSKEVHATPPPRLPLAPAHCRPAVSSPPKWWTRSAGTGYRTAEVSDLPGVGELADRSTSDPRGSRARSRRSAHHSGGRSRPRL